MREYTVTINEKDYKAKVAEINADQAVIVIDGKEYKVGLKEIGRKKDLLSGAHQRVESAQAPAASPAAPVKSLSVVSEPSLPTQRVEKVGGGDGAIGSPLPGLIIDVLVKEGDAVKAGQNVVIMEAMTMENQIQSPFDGKVARIHVQKGKNVVEGDVLIEIARPPLTTL